MTLQEYYKDMGDYNDCISRLVNEKLIKKYVCKFLADPSFENLHTSLNEKNFSDAFRHAHTLKGVARNLSFTKLYEIANEITETLRDEQPHDVSEPLTRLSAEYTKVTDVIKKIQDDPDLA